MNLEKFINISEIENCWIGYLVPGGSRAPGQEIEKFQTECKEEKVYKLGWPVNNFKETLLNNDEIVEEYDKEYEWENSKEKNYAKFEEGYKEKQSSLKKALKAMKKMQKDDLIITRLRDAKYYIGRIEEKAKITQNKDSEFYCSIRVKNWYPFTEEELPQDVIGRFSQGTHSTIERIDENGKYYKMRVLMANFYQKKATKEDKYKFDINVPIKLSKNNFNYALNYKDLEDLVYLYMLEDNKEKDYILLPSQCKVSQMKYEFNLINKNDIRDIITCQVKNDKELMYKNYLDDAKNKKIYLFSGKGIYDESMDVNEVNSDIKNRKLQDNLLIIDKEKLFEFLNIDSNAEFLKNKLYGLRCYYFNKQKDNENEENFIKSLLKKGTYKDMGDRITFKDIEKNKFFYSKDFEAFILNKRIDKEKYNKYL